MPEHIFGAAPARHFLEPMTSFMQIHEQQFFRRSLIERASSAFNGITSCFNQRDVPDVRERGCVAPIGQFPDDSPTQTVKSFTRDRGRKDSLRTPGLGGGVPRRRAIGLIYGDHTR